VPILAIAAIALMNATPAWSTSLLPVNLPEMVGAAHRIIVGRAVDEWTGRDEHGLPATITTFAISRSLKGGPLQTVRVKHLGVTRVQPDGLAVWVDGMPRYRIGGEYVLLLDRDSHLGFTAPVGLMQGVFEVRPAENGRRAAVNGVNNANLVRDLEPESLQTLGLSTERFPFVSRGRGPMHVEDLLGMIEQIQAAR
jgi:hypothetical protein